MTDLFALAIAGGIICSGLGLYLCFLAAQQKKLARKLNGLEKKNV